MFHFISCESKFINFLINKEVKHESIVLKNKLVHLKYDISKKNRFFESHTSALG